jgi:hypothetical protein
VSGLGVAQQRDENDNDAERFETSFQIILLFSNAQSFVFRLIGSLCNSRAFSDGTKAVYGSRMAL